MSDIYYPLTVDQVYIELVLLQVLGSNDLDVILQFIRLQFIADHCPPLKRDATIGMINELRNVSWIGVCLSTLFVVS